LETIELACTGFPAALGRWGFGVGFAVMPGFFRIAKIRILKRLPVASAAGRS
jgi:hypothetical protein